MNTYTNRQGYKVISKLRTRDKKYPIYIHILMAEKALGKPLPAGAVVHHVNEDRSDNRNENLVICQDHTYHKLLHRRMDAKKASGFAYYIKCNHCKKWDDPADMYITNKHKYHRKCEAEYWMKRTHGNRV